jgi:hypothetical protein
MISPKVLKEGVEVAIFASPIQLNMDKFVLEKTFNMFFKLNKDTCHSHRLSTPAVVVTCS